MTRRRRRSRSFNLKGLLFPILGVMAFVIIIILFVYLPDIYPSEDWATLRTNFIQLMPWLLMTGIGISLLVYTMRSRPANLYVYTAPMGAMIGVGAAMMIGVLDDLGVIIDEITTIHTSITVTDLQLVAIVAWTMMGLIAGVMNER